MKCKNCGFENKKGAKFCTKCGNSLEVVEETPQSSINSKYLIIALVAIIIVLAGAIGYFALSGSSQAPQATDSQDAESLESGDGSAETQQVSSSQKTTTVASESKSWVSIGSYSGSGSGSQTIQVPEGKIMVKLSAYPIKNYATNHLYVSGSNGMSGGVDWGSKSAVETRSDSFTYTSSSSEVFTIDYYETVSWSVEFYRYQ